MLNNFNNKGKFGRRYFLILKSIRTIKDNTFATFISKDGLFELTVCFCNEDIFLQEKDYKKVLDLMIDKAITIFSRNYPVLEVEIL
jgi:hypothetical protein